MVYFLETENGSLLFDSSRKRALFTCLVSLSGHHQKRCRSYGIVLLSQFHRRRRPRREKWVFVSFGTQYVPARPYLRLVRRRNAATLLGIMQRQVQPGSILHTDQWAAYRQIQRQLGLNHINKNIRNMPGTFGQVRHILFPYFNCMIPTNTGLVGGNAYLVTIQLYQNTGRFRTAN